MGTVVRLVAMAGVLTVGSCGDHRGGGDEPDRSGLPTDAIVPLLSEEDMDVLDEWCVDQFGGAGAGGQCHENGASIPWEMWGCLGSFGNAECEITVGEYEDCILALDSDPCPLMGEDEPGECEQFVADCWP